MDELLSHPDRTIRQHIAEVEQVAKLVLARHSPRPFARAGLDARAFLQALVVWHDVAKSTRWFQDYIADPEDFRRRASRGRADPRRKAHAPLGALLAMSQRRPWGDNPSAPEMSPLWIGLAVGGHHHGVPTLRAMQTMLGDEMLLAEQFAALSPDVEQCHRDLAGMIRPVIGAGFTAAHQAAQDALIDAEFVLTRTLPLADRVRLRLALQFSFSCLLEADKALLIHSRVEQYVGTPGKLVPGTVVEDHPPADAGTHVEINSQRQAAFAEVVADAEACDLSDTRPRLLTLPTGLGKTRCAGGWAFHLRHRIEQATGVRPKIFVVLPFLSVIEQTERVYRELLELGEDRTNDRTLQTSHSLAARDYQDLEDPGEAEFALDTWRSDIVLTTFDQFLLALMSDRTRHQQRFHNLCDAIVILDEVQGFPCRLWHPVGTLMGELAATGGTRFLLMTATQPALFAAADSTTAVSTIVPEPAKYARNRYRMEFDLREQPVSVWLDGLGREIASDENRNVSKWLIVLNTRRSAQMVFRFLKKGQLRRGDTILLLSSDIVPKDRLDRIDTIKRTPYCIAVTTQCVEAGVDIDMDRVIRDFAPLDSLVQAAGRCNRNGQRERSLIRVLRLFDEDSQGRTTRAFSDYVYDGPLLEHTRNALEPYLRTGLNEEQVIQAVERYFRGIVSKSVMACGRDTTQQWSRFEHDDIDVSALLRGGNDQVQFVVLKRDPDPNGLRRLIEQAWATADRWERRRALRALAPRIARVTVSAWRSRKYRPDDIADPFPDDAVTAFWFLHDDAYDEEVGLCPQPLTGFNIL
ncbi:MAG: CRISPR-associated helicase Cas3' [Thermoguttaceae bacterium]